MSDLLAPILYVMQNEVDAFWCFAGFMKRVSANFDFDQGGMKKQLGQLTELLKTYDPEFYSYLDAKDSGNLFFVFRWLLIWFKREFPFTDIMHMWEVLWTDKPCPKFHLLGKCLVSFTLKSSDFFLPIGSPYFIGVNWVNIGLKILSVLRCQKAMSNKVKRRNAKVC